MMKISAFLLSIMLLIVACGEDDSKNQEGNLTRNIETVNKGKIDVKVDKSLKKVLDSAFALYRNDFEEVELSIDYVSAREAMSLLLSANSRIVITARDYLKDEDSLMNVFDVEKHKRFIIAQDALVFFANTAFPLDTINANQIKKVLTENSKLSDDFQELSSEPEYVITNQNSSEYANLLQLVTNNENIKKPIKMLSTADSVVNYVRDNPNTIGIGLYSNVINEPYLKSLRVGFNYPDGKREFPQVVHQAYIVMERYPFIVDYYAYLLEDRRNVNFWFASYLGKEDVVQRYFNEYGIVPVFAKIKLIKE